MYKDIDSLIIYRKSATQGILKEMRDIFYDFYNCEYDKEKLSGRIYTQINNLLDVCLLYTSIPYGNSYGTRYVFRYD